MPRSALIIALVSLLWTPASIAAQTPAAQARPLTIVSAGPSGEIAALPEANEIRIVFSEPMVTLGRIPSPVRAPFVRITPALTRHLPLVGHDDPDLHAGSQKAAAVRDEVRRHRRHHRGRGVRPGARRAVSLQLHHADGQAAPDGLVSPRRPIRRADRHGCCASISACARPTSWRISRPPSSVTTGSRRCCPPRATRGCARSIRGPRPPSRRRSPRLVRLPRLSAPVEVKLATEWDKKKFPAAATLVVFETTSAVPPESWVRLQLDDRLPSQAGGATPAGPQHFTIEVEKAFFIDGFKCETQCDPDAANGVRDAVGGQGRRLREGGQGARPVVDPGPPGGQAGDAAASARTTNLTSATRRRSRTPASTPSRRRALTPSQSTPSLTAVDGQTLGYAWSGTVANWHQRAFTSFGDGHGVWESTGRHGAAVLRAQLPQRHPVGRADRSQPADADAAEAAALVHARPDGRRHRAPSRRPGGPHRVAWPRSRRRAWPRQDRPGLDGGRRRPADRRVEAVRRAAACAPR